MKNFAWLQRTRGETSTVKDENFPSNSIRITLQQLEIFKNGIFEILLKHSTGHVLMQSHPK